MSVVLDEPEVATLVTRRLAATNAASEAFFSANTEAIARVCHAMALRFQAGGRLLVHGDSAQRGDVSHVVVEFLHPVIVGKRALPAVACLSAADVAVMAGASDILMVLSSAQPTGDQEALLSHARSQGVLAIALTGARGTSERVELAADFCFAIPSTDQCIVQETQEMLYHVVWELVHVFFEHRPAA